MNSTPDFLIAAGQAGEGIRVGQYVSDGRVAMTEIVAVGAGGNGPGWLGRRVLLDRFDVGLATCLPNGSDFTTIPNAPKATTYGASDDGTAWARYVADGGRTGVETSWGLKLPTMAWLGIGPALFVKPTSGDQIVCYDIGALTPRWTIGATTIDFFALDADRVLWTDGSRRIRTYGLPEPAQTDVANFPSTFEALGRRWLVTGRGNGGFVVRPWDDATRGFVAVPLGQDAFSAMTVARDANRVVGFWSPNAGETIVQAKTIDLTAPMQDLTGVVLPFVPRLNHNVSIAPFKDPANETGADSEIVVNGAAPTSDRPHWTAKDDASLAYFRRDIDHGLYTEASTTAEMLAAITLAEDLDTRLLWCHDGTDLDLQLVKLLRPCDVVLLECYRSTAETLAQSKARWSDNLSALLSACGNLVGLIAQDYDMGGVGPAELWSVQDTLDACEAIAEMVNTSVRIILIAPFEIQRANGADAHPDLLAIVKRWVAATPGVAELRPVNAAPTPTPRPPGPKPTPKPQPTPVLRFLAPARAFGSKAA